MLKVKYSIPPTIFIFIASPYNPKILGAKTRAILSKGKIKIHLHLTFALFTSASRFILLINLVKMTKPIKLNTKEIANITITRDVSLSGLDRTVEANLKPNRNNTTEKRSLT